MMYSFEDPELIEIRVSHFKDMIRLLYRKSAKLLKIRVQ